MSDLPSFTGRNANHQPEEEEESDEDDQGRGLESGDVEFVVRAMEILAKHPISTFDTEQSEMGRRRRRETWMLMERKLWALTVCPHEEDEFDAKTWLATTNTLPPIIISKNDPEYKRRMNAEKSENWGSDGFRISQDDAKYEESMTLKSKGEYLGTYGNVFGTGIE